ncbi:MAG: hypothetical protein ACE5Q6_13415 [Dehalococcoidia bacterium]
MTTEEQAINVFFQARGEIRAFITIYFGAVAALLGWLLTHREMPLQHRFFLFFAFGLLAAINWIGIFYSFEIIEAVKQDLKGLVEPVENTHIVDEIIKLPFIWQGFLGAHIVIDLLMVALILRNRKDERHPRVRYPRIRRRP